ncbi:hypothetical protein M404DRAFT_22769 [Pisolithus tinctorius Marx 270]|uniref:Uncharacterized protein n=1 Tax=Pisolithus tinctorius Marx 270 TaxID=870435 RepID=A0A0C3KH80_PISTI|nr:hypothetical protein M404DRAFT_22769 [Pisolithus tinctorius Marx 270]
MAEYGTRGKGKEKATEMEEADDEREIGREDKEEPQMLHEGPSGAAERYVEVHEQAATAFERMARAVEWMAEAAEWGLYHEWAEWVEMRRREDVREARMAEFECTDRGWKRPQSEAAEDKNEEVDEGAEGDNKEEEEVGGEKEGGEEQEGGREQAMEK